MCRAMLLATGKQCFSQALNTHSCIPHLKKRGAVTDWSPLLPTVMSTHTSSDKSLTTLTTPNIPSRPSCTETKPSCGALSHLHHPLYQQSSTHPTLCTLHTTVVRLTQQSSQHNTSAGHTHIHPCIAHPLHTAHHSRPPLFPHPTPPAPVLPAPPPAPWHTPTSHCSSPPRQSSEHTGAQPVGWEGGWGGQGMGRTGWGRKMWEVGYGEGWVCGWVRTKGERGFRGGFKQESCCRRRRHRGRRYGWMDCGLRSQVGGSVIVCVCACFCL